MQPISLLKGISLLKYSIFDVNRIRILQPQKGVGIIKVCSFSNVGATRSAEVSWHKCQSRWVALT